MRNEKHRLIHAIGGGDDGDEQHPPPQEQVDLLVEHVYHNDTLDGVAMCLTEYADGQVAHGDAREVRRVLPFMAGQDVAHQLHTGARIGQRRPTRAPHQSSPVPRKRFSSRNWP